MSDVSGRIWSEVAKAAHAMPNYDLVGEDEWRARGDELASNAADRIIELVRDALLTPEAVEAGARGIAFVGMEELYPDQDETWRTADEEQKELFRREIRSGITAALNATGLGGEQ